MAIKNFDEMMVYVSERLDSTDVLFEDVRDALTAKGATTVESLAEVTAKDLQRMHVPEYLARELATAFRANLKERGSSGMSRRQAEMASVAELVAAYEIRRPDSPAGKRLKEIVGETACIAVDPNGGIHRKATQEVIENLQAGIPVGSRYVYNGRSLRLLKVGYRPPRMADVHPLDKQALLLLNGRCNNGHYWRGLPNEVKYILYFAANETGELQVDLNDRRSVRKIFEEASQEDVAEQLRQDFPDAADMYDDLPDGEGLPSLRMRIGGGATRHPIHCSC